MYSLDPQRIIFWKYFRTKYILLLLHWRGSSVLKSSSV